MKGEGQGGEGEPGAMEDAKSVGPPRTWRNKRFGTGSQPTPKSKVCVMASSNSLRCRRLPKWKRRSALRSDCLLDRLCFRCYNAA
jgi:hypothetical protein